MKLVSNQTADRLTKLLNASDVGRGAMRRSAVKGVAFVRAESATAVGGDDILDQCYPGVMLLPYARSVMPADEHGHGVLLTVLGADGEAVAPVAGAVYQCLLLGEVLSDASGGEVGRTRAFAGTNGSVLGSGTDNRAVRWDGTDAIQDSLVEIDDTGGVTSPAHLRGQSGRFTESARVVSIIEDIAVDIPAYIKLTQNATSGYLMVAESGYNGASEAFVGVAGCSNVSYSPLDRAFVAAKFGVYSGAAFAFGGSATTGGLTFSGGLYVSGTSTGITDGATLSTGLTFPNAGLHILDTDTSHDLILSPGSNLTADRTLTLTTGDADRTLDISAGSVTISAFGATLVDDADAATARTTLGLGTAAVQNTGTAGANVPLLNGGNTWSGNNTFPNTGLQVYDIGGDHAVIIRVDEDSSANSTLRYKPNSADRTLDMSGNLTVEAASIVNQDLTTDASPQFSGVHVGHATDTTITRVSAGVIAVQGATIYHVGGTDVAKADGGTGEDNSTGGTANTVWARPNGATGAASYRLLVTGDIAGIVAPASQAATGWANVEAYLGSNQALTTDTWNTIQIDTETTDTDSLFNTGTYTFTPATTGWYLVVFRCMTGSSQRLICSIWVGTSAELGRLTDGTDVGGGGAALVPLTGGTGYTFRVYPVSASPTAQAGASNTTLTIRRVK